MSPIIQKAISDLVRHRAGGICEYCRFPLPPFHVEHIIARKHGGITVSENLALACVKCNFHKGPNLSGLDPVTGSLSRLFHPRNDPWSNHFKWQGSAIVGRTPEARATIVVLEMNSAARVELRGRLIAEGLMQI